jgi:hypothetical protein
MTDARMKAFVASLAAGCLLVGSEASAASASQPKQVNPWAALAALSGGPPAAAVCVNPAKKLLGGGCELPMMPASKPPPAGYGVTPLLLGLAAIASAAGFWFAVEGKNYPLTKPVSPD